MRKIFSLYGATGFIGSNFCKIYDCEQVPREQRSPSLDNIIYMISTTHNYHVLDNSYIDIETNLLTLMKTLDACRDSNIDCFNFISSWFVYGDTKLPAHERSDCNPKGFYSITKHCAENLVISYCKTFNIKYRILRLCNVYGNIDKGSSKKKNALQHLIEKMKKGEEISLYNGGEFYRNYMHVEDICRAIYLVCENGKTDEIYNIASVNNYMFKDIVKIAIDELKYSGKIRTIDPPDFHKIVQVKDMSMCSAKIRSIGFKESISIEGGIRELCKIS